MWKVFALLLIGALAYRARAAYPCDNVQQYFEQQSNCSIILMEGGGSSISDKVRNMCKATVNAFNTCMTQKFSGCPSTFKADISKWETEYKERICVGDKLKDDLENAIPTIERVFNESFAASCLPKRTDGHIDMDASFGKCLDQFHAEEFYHSTLMTKTMEWARPILNKMGQAIVKCSRNHLELSTKCSEEEIKTILYYILIQRIPIGIDVSIENAEPVKVDPREERRGTVVAFGDPHIKAHGSNEIITCSSPGWTKYLENKYLSIYANNTLLSATSSATAIDKIEIILRNSKGTEVGKYLAENSVLPTTFTNGKASVTVDKAVVEISSLKGQYVRLKHTEGGSAIYLARYKQYYPVMVARLALSLLDDSTGVLVGECFDQLERTTARRRRRALDDCDADPEYKATCEYDFGVTGDPGFATAGNPKQAEEQAVTLDEEMASGASALIGGMQLLSLSLVIRSLVFL